MKKVESAAQFAGQTKQAAQNLGAVHINCFVMPAEIEAAAQAGAFFSEACEAGMLFYEDKGDYYAVYLYVNPQRPFTVPKAEKTLVFEFPMARTIPEKNAAVMETLQHSGVTFNASSKHMCITVDAQQLDAMKSNEHVCVAKAERAHAEGIWALWSHTFDPIVHLLPGRRQVLEQILSGNVWVALQPNGEIAGALKYEQKPGCTHFSNVAVAQALRGQRIGQTLMHAHFQWALAQGIQKHYLWVVDGDTNAASFHRKYGCKFDGKFSQQYILRA